MQKPGKLNGKLRERIALIAFGSLLLVTLTISSVINHREIKDDIHPPSSKQILGFADDFLGDSLHAEIGKMLDCSGFTRAVFGNYNIVLPASAAGQYNSCERLEHAKLNPADLVFFKTYSDNISHVGLCIDSLRFIHSPGIGKYVRIDSLTHNYWSRRFAGSGKVKLN